MSSPEREVGGGEAWTLANFEFAELDSACELWWCLCEFVSQRVGSVRWALWWWGLVVCSFEQSESAVARMAARRRMARGIFIDLH